MTEEKQMPEVEEEVELCTVCGYELDLCACCKECKMFDCTCPPPEPQYYVDFDDAGNIAGFYVNTIHGDNIPETAIPISETDWQTYSADANKYKLDGDTIRAKTQQELDDEAAAIPPREPTRVEILEAENAELWYEVMLEKSRNDNHDADIAHLYYEMMMGGVGA